MPADLTKKDLDALERKWKRRLAFDTGDYDARAVLPALALARAQLEGREAGGELVQELRDFAKIHAGEEEEQVFRAGADALAAKEQEIERMREALEFYADPKANREYVCVGAHDRCFLGSGPECPYCETTPIPSFYDELDFGERARNALGKDT